MIFRSRFPEPSVPDQELSAFTLAGAGDYPDRAALVDAASGRRLSYGDLRAQVDRFAGGLAQLGVGHGDIVAIALPNVPEYPVVFLGVARAGAASTTLNPAYTGPEIAAQLADSGACVVITVPECRDKFQAAAGPTSSWSCSGRPPATQSASTTCWTPGIRRQRSPSTRPGTWPRCRTQAEPPACLRA